MFQPPPDEPSPDRSPETSAHRVPSVDALDLVEEGVIVFGLDMRVTAWNTEAERLYGWKRHEVVGGIIQAAVKCSPSEPLAMILEQVHRTGGWRGEFTRTKRDGDHIIVRAKWNLRRDHSGVAVDIVETSRDLSDVRQTEEAFHRVKFQYENLFRASVASFWDLDFQEVGRMVRELKTAGVKNLRTHFREHPEFVREMIRATKIIDVNEQTFAMFGRGDRNEVLRNLSPFWPDESLPVFAESVVASIERRSHFSSEAVFHALDGRRYDTLFTVSFPPAASLSVRFLIGITDVTEAKKARLAQARSEQKYRDIFHFLPVSLWHLDGTDLVKLFEEPRAQGVADLLPYLLERPALVARAMEALKVVEVNRRSVEMMRGQSVDEFQGSVARYWTESPEVFCSALAARYSGKKGFEALIKIRAHDGTVLDALFFAGFSPVTGDPAVSLIGLIDVTDRVRAQEMLARVQAEIAHAARVSVLGELTASIAHEVNQPLTAIATNTEASQIWLSHSPPNIAEVMALNERTAAEAHRAADIIHRVRSMAVRSNPEHVPVETNSVIEESLLFLRHELQNYQVEVVVELAPKLPPVPADRVQLQQVIVNLAVNAAQAMGQTAAGARTLTIQTGLGRDDWIVIRVLDTGPGFSGETLGRLFESFYTTKATGMGIGLPICRSIIEAHGGSISARNRVDGLGAEFEIELPARLRTDSAPLSSV